MLTRPSWPPCLWPIQAQADQLREQLRGLEARLAAAGEATAAQERRARAAEDGAAEARRQLAECGLSSGFVERPSQHCQTGFQPGTACFPGPQRVCTSRFPCW